MKSLILKIKMLFSTLTTWFANVIKENDDKYFMKYIEFMN